jgi:hypothetical protein
MSVMGWNDWMADQILLLVSNATQAGAPYNFNSAALLLRSLVVTAYSGTHALLSSHLITIPHGPMSVWRLLILVSSNCNICSEFFHQFLFFFRVSASVIAISSSAKHVFSLLL